MLRKKLLLEEMCILHTAIRDGYRVQGHSLRAAGLDWVLQLCNPALHCSHECGLKQLK